MPTTKTPAAKTPKHAFAKTLKTFKTASGKEGRFFSLPALARTYPSPENMQRCNPSPAEMAPPSHAGTGYVCRAGCRDGGSNGQTGCLFSGINTLSGDQAQPKVFWTKHSHSRDVAY